MQQAINEAWNFQCLTYPNPAVGCVILGKNKELLSIQAHKEVGKEHAELNACYEAFTTLKSIKEKHKNVQDKYNFLMNNHNGIFKECTLLCTLEPCRHEGKTPSCAKLIKKLGFKEVYISSKDENPLAKGGADILNGKVYFDILKKQGQDLLLPFKKWSKENFVLFKFASCLNACVEGQISQKQTQKLNHELRNKADLIVIGGNTLRVDNPLLDARFSEEKNAPDVLIYTKHKNIDKNLNIFKTKNRKVIFSDNLDTIKQYNFTMIEGIGNLLNASKEYTHMYLNLLNLNIKTGQRLSEFSQNFKFLYSTKIGEELAIWTTK